MATKFTVQVTDYLADAVTTGDLTITEDMVDLWMQEGAKYAINRMPKRLWHHFSSESAEKTAAYASERPLRVMREAGVHDDFLDCRQITPSSAKDFATIAPVSDPVWYHENGSVDVLPTAVATIGAFKVIEVTLPTIDASVDSTISNFPADLYQACVKYAVIQAKLREFAFMRRQSQDEIEAAIALLVSAATAVAASKTQFDLVAAIIVEGSVEFDKITALLGLGEADSETSVNTALAAIVTALGKVAPIIVEASAEYDLVNPDIDAAQDILDEEVKSRHKPNKTEEAMKFLESELANGPRDKNKIEEKAKLEDITKGTLRNAKEKLLIESKQKGKGETRKTFWSLPE